MITEQEDIPNKVRSNSFQEQTQIGLNSDIDNYPQSITSLNPPQRSSSYDNIHEKQNSSTIINNSNNSLKSNIDIEQQANIIQNGSENEQQQHYSGKKQILNLVNDTQNTIGKMDKISVLLESQKLLRKLHKELENLVLRHKYFRNPESECKINSQNGKKYSQYKEIKSRSRSRSQEKKKSTKNYNNRCYSPEQKMQKYLSSSNSSILKHKQFNNWPISKEVRNFCSRYDYERDNINFNSSSDSNSPQMQYNNEMDEDEKCLNTKLEGINFKGDYSPPPKGRGYGSLVQEKRVKKNKILFYLNQLDERSEEEEQDLLMEKKDKNGKNNYLQRQEKSKMSNDSFDQQKTKHEIEQLTEILKNLSIDLQNEVIKVQQQQQLETEDDCENFKLSSSIQNISSFQNNSNNISISISKNNISPDSPFASASLSSSSPSTQQKYKFRSVEAGMDYVIRKLQNL